VGTPELSIDSFIRLPFKVGLIGVIVTRYALKAKGWDLDRLA
jgi:hypothetical protein